MFFGLEREMLFLFLTFFTLSNAYMKFSEYNIFVAQGDVVLGYNTYSDSLIAISQNAYLQLAECGSADEYEIRNKKLYHQLVDNGFVIDDTRDELAEIRLRNKEYSFNYCYDLTIIPTLDCNLKCWYCWEKHVANSQMSSEVQAALLLHVKNKVATETINRLNIEWFGGEPLLRFDSVVYPLGTALCDIAQNHNIPFSSTFITNGTFISSQIIHRLKELSPSFQITLDGHQKKHNKVRVRKQGRDGTYEQTIEGIHLISNEISDAQITVRINFDDKTLLSFDGVLRSLEGVDKNRTRIYLERVWQTLENVKGYNEGLFEVMQKAISAGFNVEYGNFNPRLVCCKTDKYQQLGVNYDGKIFKCTGRPFDEENSDGLLLPSGEIMWKHSRVAKRLGLATFEQEMCLKCQMLPLCMGPCSQKCMESGWAGMEAHCPLNGFEMSLDDYITLQFANRYLSHRKKQSMPCVS